MCHKHGIILYVFVNVTAAQNFEVSPPKFQVVEICSSETYSLSSVTNISRSLTNVKVCTVSELILNRRRDDLTHNSLRKRRRP
jgi:hypothetical protein